MQRQFVNYLWNDAEATKRDAVERLIYRSNLLGSDPRITNTGGGNTSAKLRDKHPLTGEDVDIMWVKGSGGDLRTAKREDFASLELARLEALKSIYAAEPKRGPKTPAEDRMVDLYAHCVFNLNPCIPSIDTPLHAFIPHPCVDHTHPNAVIALAASRHGERLAKEIYGDEVVWAGWQRPGFELGLLLEKLCRENPQAKGIILAQHGLINWAADDKSCYELSLDLIERAAAYLHRHDLGAKAFGGTRVHSLPEDRRAQVLHDALPLMRGLCSSVRRQIGTVQCTPSILDFVNSVDAPRLAEMGTSCPDHFLRTKIKPLYVDWHPQQETVEVLKTKLADSIKAYQRDYETYYETHRRQDSPPMRDSNPSVILIPGVGLVAWGKTKSESRVSAEFYTCAVEVIRGAEALGGYIALDAKEAFEIEYWWLEENKLRRLPPEKELARHIAVVAGGGSGIGRETALRLAAEGACVAVIDLNESSAQAVAEEITAQFGAGIGVAGTGISSCGAAIGLGADVTRRETLCSALNQTLLAYGGIDDLIVTSGYVSPSDPNGRIPDENWGRTFAINLIGCWLLADEGRRVWLEQRLPGTAVFTTSANAVVSKKGMLAYDTSKAAANHLVRELAIELAPLVRVNGVAPATVVQGSTMFPRDRVIASLNKYGLPWREEESDDDLRERLATFYAERTLTKRVISPRDQAEAIFLLVSDRLAKTTGQILAVDGGLQEAFLR